MTGPRVRIIHLTADALVALASGDLERASSAAGVSLTPWLVSDEAIGTWRYRATQVAATPADLDWVTGVIWDDDRGVVVGKAGFHAAPDAAGMVEVGYAVDPAERRRGYARAALLTMLDRARAEPRSRRRTQHRWGSSLSCRSSRSANSGTRRTGSRRSTSCRCGTRA